MKILEMKVEELIPYENNPRLNDNAVGQVSNSIKEFGFMEAILTVISLTGNYFNCRKKVICFYLWIVCNIGWTIVDIKGASYSRCILDTVQIGFSIYGLKEWSDYNG